ncbi:MAG: tetratricopeptide repeat protein [Pseudomonadota bacterium]
MHAINRAILAACLLLCPVFAMAGEAEDFQKAKDEFEKGDRSKSFQLFKSLAEAGYQPAMEEYAAEKDRNAEWEEALTYYRKLAEKNVAQAEYRIGVFYGLGHGVPQNNQEAVNWIMRAADKDNKFAINTLVRAYLKQWACITLDPNSVSQEKALAWLKRSAENEYVPALLAMADAYRKGAYGLPVDNEQAKALTAKADSIKNSFKMAEDGWARADFNVANRTLEKLIEKDYAPAWSLLGYIADKIDFHEVGVGYYIHGAEQGYAEAQYLLAATFSSGQGVREDQVLAVEWLTRAAEMGYANALKALPKNLIKIAASGQGGNLATDEKIVYWLKKAAAADDIDSVETLLDAYRTGKYGLTADAQQIEQLQMVKDKLRPPKQQKGKRKWMQ